MPHSEAWFSLFRRRSPKKGEVEIVPNEIRQFRFKIDDEFMPDELYATWLGFLTARQTDRKEWTFVKWLIEVYQGISMDICMSQYLCKKYLQDKRAQGYYQNKSD